MTLDAVETIGASNRLEKMASQHLRRVPIKAKIIHRELAVDWLNVRNNCMH